MWKRNRVSTACLGMLLTASLGAYGCGLAAPPPGSPPTNARISPSQRATISLIPEVRGDSAYGAQALIGKHTKSSIRHLVIQVFELKDGTEQSVTDAAGNPVMADVPQGMLDTPIQISNLRPETVFRIRSMAFDADGTEPAHQISRDEASFTDLTVGRDDRLVISTLPVTLADRTFAARGSGGLRVVDGSILHSGPVASSVVSLQASYSVEPNEVKPNAMFAVGIDPATGQTYMVQGDYSPLPDSPQTVARLNGVVLSPDGATAVAIKYIVYTPSGILTLRVALSPEQSALGLALLSGTPPTEQDFSDAIATANSLLSESPDRTILQFPDPNKEAAEAGLPGLVPTVAPTPEGWRNLAIAIGGLGGAGTGAGAGFGLVKWLAEVAAGAANGSRAGIVGALVGAVVGAVKGGAAGGWVYDTFFGSPGTGSPSPSGSGGQSSFPSLTPVAGYGFPPDEMLVETAGNIAWHMNFGVPRLPPGTYTVTVSSVERVEERGYRYNALEARAFGAVRDVAYMSDGTWVHTGMYIFAYGGVISGGFVSIPAEAPGWISWTFRPRS